MLEIAPGLAGLTIPMASLTLRRSGSGQPVPVVVVQRASLLEWVSSGRSLYAAERSGLDNDPSAATYPESVRTDESRMRRSNAVWLVGNNCPVV